MANIDAQLNTIRKAENGESVRDAIADAIDLVNRDGAVTLTKLTATHNGRWKAGDGTAYKEVSVNVEGGGSSNISMESFKVDIDTPNGEYKASEVIGENKAWDTIIVDTNNDLADSMGELVANEEKDYYPEDYGVSGFNKVTVQVTPTGDGPFTVNFYAADKTTIIDTQIVQKYGSASCTLLDGTKDGSLYFRGWNPNPSSVIKNLDCYPSYGDYAIDPDPNELRDSWEVICANKGAPYPIGSYKTITISPPPASPEWKYIGYGSYDDIVKSSGGNAFTARMVKVAQGESNSTSTWVSNKTICGPSTWYRKESESSFSSSYNTYTCMSLDSDGCSYWSRSIPYTDWGNCFMRYWLNNVVITMFPECLQRSIKTVEKYYTGHSNAGTRNGGNVLLEKSSLDRIWVPSIKEFKTKFQSYDAYAGSAFETYTESLGIDYYQELGLVRNLDLYDEDNMYPYDGSTDSHRNSICFRTSVANAHHGFGWLNDINFKTDPNAARIGATSPGPGADALNYRQVLIGFCL